MKPAGNNNDNKRRRKDPEPTTAVWVRGIPKNTNAEDLAAVMKRAGLLRIDPETTGPLIRLYAPAAERGDANAAPAGAPQAIPGAAAGEQNDSPHSRTLDTLQDALVVYLRPESVGLALKYLQGYEIESGYPLSVEVAPRETNKQRGKRRNHKDPAQSSVSQQKKAAQKAAALKQEQLLLSWSPDEAGCAKTSTVLLQPCWCRDHAEYYGVESIFWDCITQMIKKRILALYPKLPMPVVDPIARHPQGITCLRFASVGAAEHFTLVADANLLTPLNSPPTITDEATFLFDDEGVDFKAQMLTEEPAFKGISELDAMDRLWIESNNVTTIIGESHDDAQRSREGRSSPEGEQAAAPDSGEKDSPVASVAPGSEDARSYVSARATSKEAAMHDFERWVEEQSSDEEFAILEEASVQHDDDPAEKASSDGESSREEDN